jgi:nicotinamide-nucleotide amidase
MTQTRVLAQRVLDLCRARSMIVATAESCTGGLVAAAITDLPGSSAALDRGVVTYSNAAKVELVGVPQAVLDRHGAVSSETAEAMAAGLLARSRADVTVSVTGIAGPDGASPEKPIGLVWFGLASRAGTLRTGRQFFGDLARDGVRAAAVEEALRLLVEELSAGHQAGARA